MLIAMRALIAIVLLSGAAVALASRPPATGRSLLQVKCSAGLGCGQCPDGCVDCQHADTNGLFFCKTCNATAARTPSYVEKGGDGSCGCARGYYLAVPSGSTDAVKKCIKCEVNFYCPGGTEAQSTLGDDATPNGKFPCPKVGTGNDVAAMVTRNNGSGSAMQCVNAPGYSFIPANLSTPGALPTMETCPENTWSAGYRGQRRCTPCPSGLKTDNGLPARDFVPIGVTIPFGFSRSNGESNNDGATRSTTAAKCKVPPGYYVVGNNKVIRCPKGEYREGYVASGSTDANHCVRCPRGTTTYDSGAPLKKFCDVLLAGYYWINPGVGNANSSVSRLAGPGECTRTCQQGYYCGGGYPPTNDDDATNDPKGSGRIKCLGGLWTKSIGARNATDCLVPPGSKLVSGSVTSCSKDAGEYMPDWRLPTATGVDKCSTCGKDIKSDDTIETLDTFVLNDDGFTANKTVVTHILRTSACCYIEAGEGLVMTSDTTSSAPVYRKMQCTGNRYGVANRTYELRVAPCKDCPRGTVTQLDGKCPSTASLAAGFVSKTADGGLIGYTDPQACCTPAGYGFDGVLATVCAPGTYNDATSDPADKCKSCPEGRTTAPSNIVLLSNPADWVNNPADCNYTLPGYGVTKAGTAPDITSALDKCPIGTFSLGSVLVTQGTCGSCPNGFTTSSEGAASVGDCDSCPDGQGTSNSVGYTPPPNVVVQGSACSDCSPGFFGSGSTTSLDCIACPTLSSTFNWYFNSTPNAVTVNVTSERGAASTQQCLLEFASISTDNNWWFPAPAANMVSPPTTNSPAATNAVDCMSRCRDDSACQFYTFDYAAATATPDRCKIYKASSSTSKTKIAYKVLASNNLGGTRRRSLLADGTITPKDVGSGVWSWWIDERAPLLGVAYPTLKLGSSPTVDACLVACNDDSDCVAVVFTVSGDDDKAKSPTTYSCQFKTGALTQPMANNADSFKRSMIRYRVSYPATGTDTYPKLV